MEPAVLSDRFLPPERWMRLTAPGLVLVGIALRLWQLLASQSLSLDEAWIGLSVASRSYEGLTKPLDSEQVVPVPFLWAARLCTELFGTHDWALRLPAFLAGCVLPIIVWRIARHFFTEAWALVALAMAAVAPSLIACSVELQPHSSDALMSALVLLFIARAVHAPERWGPWDGVALGVAGALLVSLTTILLLPGAVLALLTSRHLRNNVRWLPLVGGSLIIWGLVFEWAQRTFYPHALSAYLAHFWAGTFLDPESANFTSRLWAATEEVTLADLVGTSDWPRREVQLVLAIGVCLWGLIWIGRHVGVWALTLLAMPAIAAVGASSLGRFTLTAPAMLFLVPVFVLLLTAGARGLAQLIPNEPRSNSAVIAGLVLLPWVFLAADRSIFPEPGEHTSEIMARLDAKRAPGEPLYVYARTIPAWAFYSSDWKKLDRSRYNWIRDEASVGGLAFENRPSRGHEVDPHEADGLSWPGTQGPELLGLSTGVEVLPNQKPVTRTADFLWADTEALRLRAAARPTAWILFSHVVDGADQLLKLMIEQHGGVEVDHLEAPGARAARFRFK